ncbi:MAG: helix-turn-helix domain-containing protein [Pseudomonadota bacterium]
MTKDEISERLSTRLKEARKAQGLSLESLSKLSGVSVSMISQIERGETNPTVVIIWNLTKALQIDFAGLVEDDPRDQGPIKKVIRAGETPIISARGTGCRIRILSAPEMIGDTEIYDLEFEKDGILDSQPHRNGCIENLTVFSGELMVTSDGASETVKSGDTIRYAGDKPHSIEAGKKRARAVLIVTAA